MTALAKSVFIFDDDAEILEACSFILKSRGWKVFTSEDVKNVTGKVLSALPDVILMDNWIPDTDGVTATRSIKNTPELQQIPVVLFSANRDVASLAESAGADGFLEKPFSTSALLEVLKNAIAATKEKSG